MKYVIIRCEDDAGPSARAASLLEGAKVTHLQQLAQAAAAGILRPRRKGAGVDRFALHRALFGLGPSDAEAVGGSCYAAQLEVPIGPDETAWCCELVTQRDGRIVDPKAGGITTKESEMLVAALNSQLGSEVRRWVLGQGPHHLLVTRNPEASSKAARTPPGPEQVAGQLWKRSLPAGAGGEALRALIEEASVCLERHEINRVRVDLGENPANGLWCWGPASGLQGEPAKRSAVVFSSEFPMRGFAKSLGLNWRKGPTSLGEEELKRLAGAVLAQLADHDLVYVHLRVASLDPVERQCAMERVDRLLVRPLTEQLPDLGAWRLLVALDDRRDRSVPFVAIGSGLPQRPVVHLDAEHLAQGLAMEDGTALYRWFTAA